MVKGTSYHLNSESPLEKYPLIKSLKSTLSDYKTTAYDDFCGDFNAAWQIIGDQLYLTNIYSCNISFPRTPPLSADLKSLFTNVTNGKVSAHWFTGDLWIPKGGSILSRGSFVVYPAETRITVVNGKVTATKDFNYPLSNQLIYLSENGSNDALIKFIYSHIDWNKLPALNKQTKRVAVSFEPGLSGKPENIKLIRENPGDALFNEETKRVFSLIPMGAYYRNGVLFKQPYTMLITFSEELRQKYSK